MSEEEAALGTGIFEVFGNRGAERLRSELLYEA